MADIKQQKRIAGSTAYTIGAGLLMNGVLQIFIYPYLNRHMGSEMLGSLLFIMGIAAIVCPSIGQALNTSRLVVRRTAGVVNGDYDRMLLLFGSIGGVISLVIGRSSIGSPVEAVIIFVLILLMVFRFYGDVEYRLNLNYRKYFTYYAVLTGGYLAGFGLFFLTGMWHLIFLTGEVLALLYLAVTGTVFSDFLTPSRWFSTALRRGIFLMFSYVITNVTLNIDRLVLKFLISDLAVTQYYAVSLLGKTLVLLVAPINTIIISFLTKRKENLTRVQYLKFVGAGYGVSLVFFIGAQIFTPILLRLFYGNLYASVRPVIGIVNASQVLGVLSAYLFIVVLTFTEEKWQMILQILHLAMITALVLSVTGKYGLTGFSTAVLIANAARAAIVTLFGLYMVGRKKNEV